MSTKKREYYPSQKQAAVATGRPIELIRQACAEDKTITLGSGRILAEPLDAWLSAHDKAEGDAPPEEGETGLGKEGGKNISREELKRRREAVGLERERLNLDIQRDSMLPVADYEAALAAMLSGFVATLNQVPGRASQKIVAKARLAIIDLIRRTLTPEQFAAVEAELETSLIETGDIHEIIEEEIGHARATLAEGKFLDAE